MALYFNGYFHFARSGTDYFISLFRILNELQKNWKLIIRKLQDDAMFVKIKLDIPDFKYIQFKKRIYNYLRIKILLVSIYFRYHLYHIKCIQSIKLDTPETLWSEPVLIAF
uniref:Uncharacterized protein n=1 Tax=Heterorhabditis bacteriophora TaxID=37862 RepID=A0A1I7WGD4_HETBA